MQGLSRNTANNGDDMKTKYLLAGLLGIVVTILILGWLWATGKLGKVSQQQPPKPQIGQSVFLTNPDLTVTQIIVSQAPDLTVKSNSIYIDPPNAAYWEYDPSGNTGYPLTPSSAGTVDGSKPQAVFNGFIESGIFSNAPSNVQNWIGEDPVSYYRNNKAVLHIAFPAFFND